MIITLTGPNAYALRKRLDELLNKFVEAHGELALERIDAETADSRTIIEAVQSTSLLSSAKLVVVRDLALNKSAQADIEQIISSVDAHVDLILVEPFVDRRSSYFKVLKSKTKLEDSSNTESSGLARWLVEEAKNQGGDLSYADANFLIERVGLNQSLLANELAKLITYNPKITREHIELLAVKNPQSRVFDLLEAAFKGNKSRALNLYGEQRAQKAEPLEILGMIAWQLRLIAFAKMGQAKSLSAISSDLGINSFPVSKASDIAQNLTSMQLGRLVDDAYRIDKLAKSKKIDLDEALKTYLTTI